jgi:hypothetical protein
MSSLACSGPAVPSLSEADRVEQLPANPGHQAQPSPTEQPPASPDEPALSPEARLDAALRAHGDFGVLGDLSAGLAAVEEDFRVRLTEREGGLSVDLGPHSGEGHDYQFFVSEEGTIENVSSGQIEPIPNEELDCASDQDCVAAQTPNCCCSCTCDGYRPYARAFLEWILRECALESCPAPEHEGECTASECDDCPTDTADHPVEALCRGGRCVLAP